ncbi:hypothetical protein TRVA0_042S00386 [Trichomonascus vanleenenianus]|uniref:uncharacterized protein n=1 Tax=Trichomonascus vanleenenianus TaxID=2268995 RepID=UPI003ECA9FEF
MASSRKVPALNSTSVGTKEWVDKETTLARDLVVADVEGFAYTARRDIEWLNEYVSDILEGKNIDLPGLMQTPGRLKGALSPRKARIQAHSALRHSRSRQGHVRFGDEAISSPLAVSPFKVTKNSSALGRIDSTPLRLFRNTALPSGGGQTIPDLKPAIQQALIPAASIEEKVKSIESSKEKVNVESEGEEDSSFVAISRSIKRTQADNTTGVINEAILKEVIEPIENSHIETKASNPEKVEEKASSGWSANAPSILEKKSMHEDEVPVTDIQDTRQLEATKDEKKEKEKNNDNEDEEADDESPKVTRSTLGFASLPAKQPITKKSFAKTPSTVLMSEKRVNASGMLSRLRKDPTPFETKLADSKVPISNGSSSNNTTTAATGDSTVATSIDYSSKRSSRTEISEHDLPPPSPIRSDARVSVHYPRIETKAKSASPLKSKDVPPTTASGLKASSPQKEEFEYVGPIKLSKSLSPEKRTTTSSNESTRPLTAPSPIKYPAPAALPPRTASQNSQKSNSSQTSHRSFTAKLQSTFSKNDSPLPPPSAVKKDLKSPTRSPMRHFSASKGNPESPSLVSYTAGMFRRAKQLLFDRDQPGSPLKDRAGSPSRRVEHPSTANKISSNPSSEHVEQPGSALSPQKSAPRSPQKDTVSRLLAPTFASANRRAQSPTRMDHPGSPLAKKATVPYPEIKRTKVMPLDPEEGSDDGLTKYTETEESKPAPVKPMAKAPEHKGHGLTSIELKAGSQVKTQAAATKKLQQNSTSSSHSSDPAPPPPVKQLPKEETSKKQPQQKPSNKPLTIKIPMAAQREMEQKKKEREAAKSVSANRTSTAAPSSIPQAIKTKASQSTLKQKTAKVQEQPPAKRVYAAENENRQPQQQKQQPRANGAAAKPTGIHYKQPGAAIQSATAGSAKRTSDQAHLETPSEKRTMRVSKLGGPGYKKAGNQTPSLMKSTIVQQAKAVGNSAIPQVEGVKFSSEKINFASVNGSATRTAPNPFRQNPTVSAANVSTPKASTSLFGGSKSGSKLNAGDDIVLPEIMSESEDDDDGSVLQDWANSPQLRDVLLKQQKVDPDSVFGPIAPLQMEEVFKSSRLSRFRPRSSSANWSGQDKLSQQEIDRYASEMGYKNQ